MRFLRTTILTIIAALALGVSSTAFAVESTIIVEQVNPSGQYGSWILSTPSGTKSSTQRDTSTSIPNMPTGQYNLTIQPPRGATTSIQFYDANDLVETVDGNTARFQLNTATILKIVIGYHYEGMIDVKSDPAGVNFELAGQGNLRLTGTTPARFERMSPLFYTVKYTPPEGCFIPKPISRNLEPGGKLIFTTGFTCGNNKKPTVPAVPTAQSSSASSKSSTPAMTDKANVTLFFGTDQTETIPGGVVQYALGARNISTTTLRDVTLTVQFDPNAVTLHDSLPQGGRLVGNTAVWEIPAIFAGQSWNITLPVRFSSDLAQGTQVLLTARIDGDDVRLPPEQLHRQSVTMNVGIALLPKTGSPVATALAMLGLVSALLLTFLIRRKQQVALTA